MLLKRKREKKERKGREGKEKTKALCRVASTEPRKARRCTAPSRYRPWRDTPPYRHDHNDDHGHGCTMRAVMATAARKRATVVARRSVESNGANRPGNAGRKKGDIDFSIISSKNCSQQNQYSHEVIIPHSKYYQNSQQMFHKRPYDRPGFDI